MVTHFWRIVTVVTVWHVAASVCYYGVYAGTPLFRDAFTLSGLEVGFVIASLTLGYALFLLPLGIATDQFGERWTLTGGLLGLSLGSFTVAIAPNYWLLLIAAFLLGSMYGSATPGTNKAIFDQIEPGLQHRAIGIKQIGPTMGGAIGTIIITGFAGLFFWQSGFIIAAITGLVVTVAFFLLYGGASQADATYPDFRGLLSNRPFVVMLLSGVCFGAAFYTTTGYTVLFLNESVGATIATAGIVLAALQFSSSAGKVIVGILADVLPGSPRTRTSMMLLVQGAGGGTLFLLLPRAETPVAAGAVFIGLGVLVLGSSGLYYSTISTLVDEEELGAASAAGQLAMTVSGLFAPPIFGYLIDVTGYWAAWTFLSSLSFVAAGLVSLVVLKMF